VTRSPFRSLVAAAAITGCALSPARIVAQVAPVPTTTAVPWAAGEHLEYSVKWGFIPAGSARMDVLGTDTIRGRTAWRLRLNITGGALGADINDDYDSWLDVETLNSLRFLQNLDELGKKKQRDYAIFPDRAMFHQEGKPERASVSNPLDDAAFFYFLRTIDLEVGKEYSFNRYFDPDANPVIIRVLRKEKISVAGGKFETIVLQPIIKTSGLFSQKGEAKLWLTDDKRRMLVQLKTNFGPFSLGLYLRSFGGTQ